MKRTVGFHVPSGAYHHRIAVTLLAEVSWRRLRQGSDALDARGRLAAKRVRSPQRRLPPSSRPIIVDATERPVPDHRSLLG